MRTRFRVLVIISTFSSSSSSSSCFPLTEYPFLGKPFEVTLSICKTTLCIYLSLTFSSLVASALSSAVVGQCLALLSLPTSCTLPSLYV